MADAPGSGLPLHPRIFMILVSLSQGPAHGYQIKKAVEERSEGEVRLDAGSLYRSMAKLLDEGLITETDERPDPEDDDPRRRYYELTEAGRRIAAAEALRLDRLLGIARVHLGEAMEGTS